MAESHHGNTPAAWIAVAVAFVAFTLGSIAMLADPVRVTMLWIAIVLAVLSLPLFLILAKMGLHTSSE